MLWVSNAFEKVGDHAKCTCNTLSYAIWMMSFNRAKLRRPLAPTSEKPRKFDSRGLSFQWY